MSGGLASYPRTGGGSGGGSAVGATRHLLAVLRSAIAVSPPQDHTRDAGDLVQALEKLSRRTADHSAMVALSTEVRDVIFAAKQAGAVLDPLHARAMEVCAVHWVAINPLSGTGLAARAHAAGQAFANAVTGQKVRAAQEEAGTVAWLYRASALLGQDLSASHLANAVRLGQTLYTGSRDHRGMLSYLECGASYNVNQFVRVDVPGSPFPLVLVGEAKGGSSGYGLVTGPKLLLANQLRVVTVSQRDPAYALTRADYMVRDKGMTLARAARREAGDAILRAFGGGHLAYLAVRGGVQGTILSAAQEVFECP